MISKLGSTTDSISSSLLFPSIFLFSQLRERERERESTVEVKRIGLKTKNHLTFYRPDKALALLLLVIQISQKNH